MAIYSRINKLTPQDAVIKIINDAGSSESVTINILGGVRHVIESDVEAPKVNISAIETSISNNNKCIIERTSGTVMNFFQNTKQILNVYAAINQNNSENIKVTLTGEGMVVIRLLKVGGFTVRPVNPPETGLTDSSYAMVGLSWIEIH